jgi:hypothetical protein
MDKNWTEVIEAKDENGKSIWKTELSKIEDYKELMCLYNYLTETLKKDVDKFFGKSRRVAGRRARNTAQKIKDTMSQLRITIQKTVENNGR